jgi:hypothetical protein
MQAKRVRQKEPAKIDVRKFQYWLYVFSPPLKKGWDLGIRENKKWRGNIVRRSRLDLIFYLIKF